jgi:hypothetical protein
MSELMRQARLYPRSAQIAMSNLEVAGVVSRSQEQNRVLFEIKPWARPLLQGLLSYKEDSPLS